MVPSHGDTARTTGLSGQDVPPFCRQTISAGGRDAGVRPEMPGPKARALSTQDAASRRWIPQTGAIASLRLAGRSPVTWSINESGGLNRYCYVAGRKADTFPDPVA